MVSALLMCFYIIIEVLSLLGVLGNLLLIYVIIFGAKMKSKTNLIICNMAVSDLISCLMYFPWDYSRLVGNGWAFGQFGCLLFLLLKNIVLYVSAISTVIIALDRYVVLVLKRQYSLLKRIKSFTWMLITWILSSIICAPFSLTVGLTPASEEYDLECRFFNSSDNINAFIAVYYSITIFLLPLLFTTWWYIRIAFIITNRTIIGVVVEPKESEDKLARSKRKSLKLVIMIATAFGVTQLPLNLYLQGMYTFDVFSGTSSTTHTIIALTTHVIATFYVLCNPIICLIFTQKFRSKLNTMTIRRELSNGPTNSTVEMS